MGVSAGYMFQKLQWCGSISYGPDAISPQLNGRGVNETAR